MEHEPPSDRSGKHTLSIPQTYPALIYRGIRDFGFSTVLCCVLVYGIFILGQRLVAAHEQYLIDTSALFKANDKNVHDLVETERGQTKALSRLNTTLESQKLTIEETQKKSMQLHEKQLETLSRIEKVMEETKQIQVKKVNQ